VVLADSDFSKLRLERFAVGPVALEAREIHSIRPSDGLKLQCLKCADMQRAVEEVLVVRGLIPAFGVLLECAGNLEAARHLEGDPLRCGGVGDRE
jgi:hypothetical protein